MADRVSVVDWKRRGDRAWSRAELLREYFRRAARWAAAYGCDSPLPFYDIAACVDASVRADARVVGDVVDKVESENWEVIGRIAEYMLHWAALRATSGVNPPDELEDPFEPLILLFERGGGFHVENGEVNLEWVSIPMKWRSRADRPPMASFAAADLDEIDRAGSLDQFGYIMKPM